MDDKKIIYILVVIIIILISIIGVYFFSNLEIDYKEFHLNSTCSIDVPISNNIANKTIGQNITVLNDTKYDLTIIYYNNYSDILSSNLKDSIQLAAMKDSYKVNSEQMTLVNETVWFNKNTGYYMTFLSNNATYDNMIIITKNKNILEHMINSIKYVSINITNSTNDSIVSSNSDNTGNHDYSSSSSQSNDKSSSVDSDDGYHYAGQFEAEVKKRSDGIYEDREGNTYDIRHMR
ncbi:hypothetical protein BGI41_00610 [Methanobrevibacter sp. 87.7]|uniref:hypothetical protein n=1 Tax=Methanobrevibacter sp. 87.7 TaxID=387957 RepID=UPI000B508337|nr:hypothetical protein [Methanobrevibacter sp. 87.7]OWT33771.1 hypothetical protein BGI41_00610 [Methanobrevibacter sp. 87.7]